MAWIYGRAALPVIGEGVLFLCLIFFFQAEDGIRDPLVTGVQTCALPICSTVSVSELLNGLNKGSYTTSLACKTNGSPIVVTTQSFTMPTTPVVCTFTNTGSTIAVSLTKLWVNAVTGDTTTLSITGAQVSGATGGTSTAPSTTTDATATAVSGSTVSLAEALGGLN